MVHELVHQFQFREYQVFNAWLKPFEQKVTSETIRKIFSRYIYFDMPYFFGPYRLAGNYKAPGFQNFFEFEAERFATNRTIR
jgi:hypothetical protein